MGPKKKSSSITPPAIILDINLPPSPNRNLILHLFLSNLGSRISLALDLLIATAICGLITLRSCLVVGVHLINTILVVDARLEMVEWLESGTLVEEDPALDEVWERLGDLVAHVGAGGDGEDVVEFLKRALLGLGNPEEDHDEGDDVGAGVEAKDAGGSHSREHEWQEEGQHASPKQTGGDGPAHADFTVGQGEDFSRVGEGNGSFSWGVEHRKDIDERRNKTQMSLSLTSMRAKRPAASSDQAILGNVKSNKARRPKVSIVHSAGKAKRKLMRPNPNEAHRAWWEVKPEFLKMVEE